MHMWMPQYELDVINSGSWQLNIAYQKEYMIDSERHIVQQLCVKYYVAWK